MMLGECTAVLLALAIARPCERRTRSVSRAGPQPRWLMHVILVPLQFVYSLHWIPDFGGAAANVRKKACIRARVAAAKQGLVRRRAWTT